MKCNNTVTAAVLLTQRDTKGSESQAPIIRNLIPKKKFKKNSYNRLLRERVVELLTKTGLGFARNNLH
jgi:hypothetical protein